MKPSPHTHLKFKICISGAAETGYCAPNALEQTKELGREVVRQGGVLVTGATTGAPLWAAIGAKEVGGFVIGLSPAYSEKEHVEVYKLPIDYHDMIVYTGFGYSGRNLLLTRSADAVIVTCGRMGTLNEFTIAFEDKKPLGVLLGTGGMSDELETIVQKSHRAEEHKKIAYDANPKELVQRIIEFIRSEKVVEI